jgi:ABC-type uncharacterized transport system permease subunit
MLPTFPTHMFTIRDFSPFSYYLSVSIFLMNITDKSHSSIANSLQLKLVPTSLLLHRWMRH